jgi:hypothetical protein
MRRRSTTNRLLPHYERFLGPFSGHGVLEPEWNAPFSALRWRGVIEADVDVVATLGVGRHVLNGRRQEILVALRSVWEDVALPIVASVGTYVVDRHAPLNVDEVIAIPAELGTPADALVVASADALVQDLGLCREYEPPIEILWLVPRATRDRFGL